MRRYYVLTICLFSWIDGRSQKNVIDNHISKALISAKSLHSSAFESQLQLYNGYEYKEIRVKSDLDRGHAYFMQQEFQLGAVRFNGVDYDEIPLIYDLVSNELITKLPNTNIKIVLTPELVETFLLSGHIFQNVKNVNSGLSKGYYDVIYDNEIKILVKRYKVITESNDNLLIIRNYIERKEIYVKKANEYHLIKRKKDVIDLFEKTHPGIKKYFRGSSFKKEGESLMISFVRSFEKVKSMQ